MRLGEGREEVDKGGLGHALGVSEIEDQGQIATAHVVNGDAVERAV